MFLCQFKIKGINNNHNDNIEFHSLVADLKNIYAKLIVAQHDLSRTSQEIRALQKTLKYQDVLDSVENIRNFFEKSMLRYLKGIFHEAHMSNDNTEKSKDLLLSIAQNVNKISDLLIASDAQIKDLQTKTNGIVISEVNVNDNAAIMENINNLKKILQVQIENLSSSVSKEEIINIKQNILEIMKTLSLLDVSKNDITNIKQSVSDVLKMLTNSDLSKINNTLELQNTAVNQKIHNLENKIDKIQNQMNSLIVQIQKQQNQQEILIKLLEEKNQNKSE